MRKSYFHVEQTEEGFKDGLMKLLEHVLDEENFLDGDGFIEMSDGKIYATKNSQQFIFEVILKAVKCVK